MTLIAMRIQQERTGELRQFASGSEYITPAPSTNVTVTVKPNPSVTVSPSVSPGAASPADQPKGGYTLDMILNPDANTAAGRTGYDCTKGGCPEGVEVSGFYKAPNGRYYPVASSSGPTSKDLAYVYKKVEEKVNEYASLKEKLATCSGSTCTAIQNQMNQLKTDLGYTSAKLEDLIKPAPVDEAKVKVLEQYQTLVTKYQDCVSSTGFANGGCQQLLSAAQQFAATNGFTAEERAAIDHAVKVNSLINDYVEAGLKFSECQSQTPGKCSQYSGIMTSISNNKTLSADELKLAKDALVENQKISALLNNGVTKGQTPSQIISALVAQTDLTQAEAKKMVTQATLSMATNVLDALQKTTPGGEVAIYTQLFPNEKNSACAKDISCVQQKLTTYIHTNAPTLDAKYKAAISELNLSRDLAKASDATGYDAAQLLATLKAKYKSELGSATVTNLDQAISLLNKKLPDRLQTDEVSMANIDAIVRQATGQQLPKTSLQTAYEAYKNERTPDGVRISPEKEKALQKAFEAEQIAALERMKPSLGNDYNKTLAAFYKGELVPTVLEDQLHPKVQRQTSSGVTFSTTTRVGYTWLNKAISGIESTIDSTFGLSASEAKSEAEGAIDLYGLKVTPATKIQLEAFYKNKTKLESAGYFRSGEESEQALIQQIAAGNFDVSKKVESMGAFGGAAMEALHVIDSVGDGWVTQRLYPNLTNIQEAGVAKTYVKAVVSNDPTILSAVEEKIQTNDETRQAYETYKKSAAADEKTVEDFLIHQYQAALDVQDKAAANMYDAPAIQSLFPQGTQEASWLRQAALEGTVDVQALSAALDAAKRESTLAENALNTESYRRGNSQENISAAESVVQQKNFVQAELLAEAYINSIPEDVKKGIQKDLELKLKDQNTSIDVQAYQKEQLASYLNDTDVQFLMGSGGVDITMQGVLNGTYDMKVATRVLSDIKANDPLAAMALGLNKFENGALLQGQQIMDDPKSTFGDKFRAGVMMSAKPALTAVAIVLPPLRIAQLAGTAITAQTALAVAGDAMGVYMTGSSLQDTATVCTFRDGMDTTACMKSAGMTLFAASSALSSASQLNSLARAARVTRLEQGIATGIDAADIAWTSAVGTTLAKNPVTSLLVSKGNLAVADLAVFTRQAGATSFEGIIAALPKAEQAALNISAMTTAEKVAFTNQALTAAQARITQNLASTVYSGAAESMVLQTARNGLGTLVFGSAAVDACSQAVDLNCLTSFGLFGVSAVRLVTGPLVAKAPQSLTAQNITRADQLVNYSQAAVACSAAAMGKAAKEACMTNIMFAGLSAGQTAIRDAQSAAPGIDDPFTLRTQALADAAVLGNEFYSGNDVMINGKPVRVTGDNRAALLADVQSRLSRATTGMAQIIGRTNSLVAGRLEDAKSIIPDEMSTADKGLAAAMDAWQSLINADGTIKQYLIVDGPAEADGTPARIAVTDRMIEDAYRAVTAAERQVAIETQLKAYPERTNLEQLGDRITELFGRNVPELTELQAARSAFIDAAKTADTNPVAYEIAAERLGKAKTEVERMSMTSAQRDLARQLDAEQEALRKVHDDMAIVQLRIELLQDPEKIDAMMLNQGDLVRDASGQLVRALAAGSDEIVIAAARKKLNRAQEVYETVQQVKQTNDTITGEGKRTTIIRTENDLALGPLVAKQLVSVQKIAVLEQSIQAGNTLRGRIALAAARIFNIEPASVENVSARELRVIKTLISKQLGIQVSEEHLALYREFAKANEAVNRVMRSVSILDRYDPARTGVEGPLTEARAQRLAQIEEISKGYFQDILPDGVSRSIEDIRADIQKTLPEKRVLFRTQSTDEILRAFDVLIDEHRALIGGTDRDAILIRHEAAMERLNSALEKLYGRDSADFLEASIAVRKSLKQIDLATQIQAAESRGDIDLATRLRKSAEVNLSMFNSLAPETRLKLENIIRDTEYRLTIYEQDFRSLRAKQLETIFGLLSNDGTAIELTTSGGKTWVVTAISRVQNEIFDRKAVIVFRKGQAGQFTKYVQGLYGSDDAVVRVTSDMFQGDERVTADALQRIQDAKVIIVEPEDLPFLRNMATMKYDNPKVRADVIHAYLTAVSNAGFSIDELNLALDTTSRMINPANGQNSAQIEERILGVNEDVGRVMLDLDILRDGKFDAWRTSENGKPALTEGYQVTKTNPDGSVTMQVIKHAKFTDAALERLLPALEKKFGLDEGVLRKVSELRDANRGSDAFSKALADAGISPEAGAQAVDVLGAVNRYANAMTAVPGTGYFRGVNVYGARVTIPGSEGVASAQQTYNKYLQPVYEIVGALAHGEGFIPLRGSGLAVAPELAYQSTMADVIADAMILSGNVQIGGVTGTIGSAYDVLANAYRMVTSVDGETARRIFDEGRLSLRRFTVARQEDVMRVLAEQIKRGVYDTSKGLSSRGNLKITLGGDLGLSTLEVAREIVRQTGSTEKTFVIGVNGDTFYEVKLNADGTIAEGFADEAGNPNKVVTTDEVSQWYMNEGRENVISILDRGSATGGNIRTPEYVPGALLTSDTAPEYLVLQAASRLDRTGGLADQHLILAKSDAQAFADSLSLDALSGTPEQFAEFRKNAIAVQDAYAKEQSAQANTLGMELAASRPLAHGVMMFGTIDSPAARQVADWLSDRLLEMSTHEDAQDTSLKQKTATEVTADTQQKTLAARNERFKQLVDFYDRLFENPDNQPYLKMIQETAPDIYTRMLNSRNALVDVPQGADPLAYAVTQGGTSKDAPLLQGDLGSFRNAHNISVTQESEAYFTGGTVDEKRIAQARNQAETIRNEQLAEGILSEQGKTAVAIAERANASTRQLSTRNRETLTLVERAVAFYQQRAAQANSLIALNALQRQQTARNANGVAEGDVVVGQFEPAELIPCAVRNPFVSYVLAAGPCAPVGVAPIKPQRVAVTIQNGLKASYTDASGTYDFVFDGTPLVSPLGVITSMVLHYEAGDVTLGEEDLKRMTAGDDVRAISIETYLNASQTIQQVTQQLNSWGITDTVAAAITQSVRRDAENRVRNSVGGGSLDTDALNRAVDALIAYEQDAYADLVTMSSGDRKAMTVDILDRRTAVSRSAAATALRELLPGGTDDEASTRLSRISKQTLSDIIVGQRKAVENVQAKAAAQKRNAARIAWWKGLGARMSSALAQTRFGNVISFITGLFSRQPTTGTITIARTDFDRAFFGIREGRYADAYTMLNTARTRNLTKDPDIEKITSALREDIARRLTIAIGISVAQDSPMVDAMLAYEAAFVRVSATWNSVSGQQNSTAIFVENIDQNTEVARLRRFAISEIRIFREKASLGRGISPDAVFGVVVQPLVASTYALIQSENPDVNAGSPVSATDQIALLRQAISSGNYMEVNRIYRSIQSNAQTQPIVFNNAMEIIYRDVADRLSAELRVPIAWDHAAVSRIAEYELSILAFTDAAAQDPAIVDYETYFDAGHANASVVDALAQAEAVFDTLAAPLGLQRDGYSNGLRRMINPVMQSIWNEMQLDAKIAARIATSRELQEAAKGSTRWQARPTPNAWVKTADAVRAFFFPRLTDLRGFPTATPNNVSALTSYTLRYAGVALIPGVGPALAGGIFVFDLAHTLLDQFGGLVVRFPPLQRILLMDSPRMMAWLERTNTRNTSLQVLKNIVSGSREGWVESIVNATFLDIGNPNWTPLTAITRGVLAYGIHSTILPLHVWDIYRAAQAYTERVSGRKSPVLEYGYEKPDYWSQDRESRTLWIIPRWIVNATPETNTLVYILTRVILPGGQLLIPYDTHRIALGGGLGRISVSSFNPLAWRWLDIPKRAVTPVVNSAPSSAPAVSNGTNTSGANQTQPSDASATSGNASTQQTSHIYNGITTGGARGVSRYLGSRTWFTVGQFFVPLPARLLALAVNDGIQFVWYGVHPSSYQWVAARITRIPVLQGIADVLQIPAGRGADERNAYFISRAMFVSPWWVNGLLFAVNDIIRARTWVVQRGRAAQVQNAVQPQSLSQSTPPASVTDLSGYTLTDVVIPDGATPVAGMLVTARYTNTAGETVRIPARIRVAAISRGSWSIAVDGVNTPIVVTAAQVVFQSVAEPSPAYIALNNLIADITSPMAPAERMMELTDDMGAIGEIIGQTPTQMIQVLTQDAEQTRTQALLDQVRERERQLNELRALEASRQTAEFLLRNAAYQAEYSSGKHFPPVIAESIATGVIPSFEAWLDSRELWRRIMLTRALQNQQAAQPSLVTFFEQPDVIYARLQAVSLEIVQDERAQALAVSTEDRDALVARIEEVLQQRHVTRTDFRIANVDYDVWLRSMIAILQEDAAPKQTGESDKADDQSSPVNDNAQIITDLVVQAIEAVRAQQPTLESEKGSGFTDAAMQNIQKTDAYQKLLSEKSADEQDQLRMYVRRMLEAYLSGDENLILYTISFGMSGSPKPVQSPLWDNDSLGRNKSRLTAQIESYRSQMNIAPEEFTRRTRDMRLQLERVPLITATQVTTIEKILAGIRLLSSYFINGNSFGGNTEASDIAVNLHHYVFASFGKPWPRVLRNNYLALHPSLLTRNTTIVTIDDRNFVSDQTYRNNALRGEDFLDVMAQMLALGVTDLDAYLAIASNQADIDDIDFAPGAPDELRALIHLWAAPEVKVQGSVDPNNGEVLAAVLNTDALADEVRSAVSTEIPVYSSQQVRELSTGTADQNLQLNKGFAILGQRAADSIKQSSVQADNPTSGIEVIPSVSTQISANVLQPQKNSDYINWFVLQQGVERAIDSVRNSGIPSAHLSVSSMMQGFRDFQELFDALPHELRIVIDYTYFLKVYTGVFAIGHPSKQHDLSKEQVLLLKQYIESNSNYILVPYKNGGFTIANISAAKALINQYQVHFPPESLGDTKQFLTDYLPNLDETQTTSKDRYNKIDQYRKMILLGMPFSYSTFPYDFELFNSDTSQQAEFEEVKLRSKTVVSNFGHYTIPDADQVRLAIYDRFYTSVMDAWWEAQRLVPNQVIENDLRNSGLINGIFRKSSYRVFKTLQDEFRLPKLLLPEVMKSVEIRDSFTYSYQSFVDYMKIIRFHFSVNPQMSVFQKTVYILRQTPFMMVFTFFSGGHVNVVDRTVRLNAFETGMFLNIYGYIRSPQDIMSNILYLGTSLLVILTKPAQYQHELVHAAVVSYDHHIDPLEFKLNEALTNYFHGNIIAPSSNILIRASYTFLNVICSLFYYFNNGLIENLVYTVDSVGGLSPGTAKQALGYSYFATPGHEADFSKLLESVYGDRSDEIWNILNGGDWSWVKIRKLKALQPERKTTQSRVSIVQLNNEVHNETSDDDADTGSEVVSRISITQTTQDAPVNAGAPQVQTPQENPIHALWLADRALRQDAGTLASIDEYVQRIITSAQVDPADIEALDNYIEALFRQYYIDNTLRFSYPDTQLGRYITMLRSLLTARTRINDSDMTALSLAFGKLMVPVLRERLLSVARDARDGTPVTEMDQIAFLTQIQTAVDEVVTNYARTHLKKGLFGLGGAKYSEFENPWRNLPQTTVQNQAPVANSVIIGMPVGGAIGGAWFAALWTNLPGFQYWINQVITQPEQTWNLFRVWVKDQYASLFSNAVNVYERTIMRVSPEPVPVCIP